MNGEDDDMLAFFGVPHAHRTSEDDPLFWRHEYVITNVLAMYEHGNVRSFTVDQCQGDRPRLRWSV